MSNALCTAAAIGCLSSAALGYWGERFDSYENTVPLPDQSTWEPWGGDAGAADFYASSAQSLSGPNSVTVDGLDDAVHQYSGYNHDAWTYTAWQFIPPEMNDSQYFILLNTYPTSLDRHWSLQIECDGAAELIRDNTGAEELPMIKGEWVEIRVEIDLEEDTQSVYYGGSLLVTKSWTAGVAGGGAKNIAAVDLWANESAHEVYYDNLSLIQLVDPICPADVNRDGVVDVLDLLLVLGAWGSDDEDADIVDDGIVDVLDLLEVLSAWGPCPELPIMRLGGTLFEAEGNIELTIPPDFFGPGSGPFDGQVALIPSYLGTGGAFEIGTTDTVITRLESVPYPDDHPVEISIQLTSLSLMSMEPITVLVEGEPQQWDVTVGLSEEQPEGLGSMTINPTGPDQGTFSAQLPVKPVLTFTREGDTLELDLEPVDLECEDGTWLPKDSCPWQELEIPGFPLGPCMDDCFLQSPTLQLWCYAPVPDPDRPPAYVDPDADVDPAVGSLGRFAVISAGAHVGAGAVIGPNALIGPGAFIGDNALIGERAQIGAMTIVENGAVVGGDTECLENAFIGAESVVGRGCLINQGVQIGPDSRIGGGCQVGTGVQIGASVLGANDLDIGEFSVIGDGLFLENGSVVAPGTELLESMVLCTTFEGESSVVTVSECTAIGGWKLGIIRTALDFSGLPGATGKEVEPIDPDDLPADLEDLDDDVKSAGDGDPGGKIVDREYVPVTYDCEDFADDMEKALEDAGYDATFTCMWKWEPNPDWHWYNALWTSTGKWTSGHAVADVHSGGKTIWIEPQAGGRVGIDLDKDGDGKVEYSTEKGTDTTDDSWRIEVWPDRAAAEKAGRKFD